MEANFIKEVSRIINHIAQAIEENDDECDVDINRDTGLCICVVYIALHRHGYRRSRASLID